MTSGWVAASQEIAIGTSACHRLVGRTPTSGTAATTKFPAGHRRFTAGRLGGAHPCCACAPLTLPRHTCLPQRHVPLLIPHRAPPAPRARCSPHAYTAPVPTHIALSAATLPYHSPSSLHAAAHAHLRATLYIWRRRFQRQRRDDICAVLPRVRILRTCLPFADMPPGRDRTLAIWCSRNLLYRYAFASLYKYLPGEATERAFLYFARDYPSRLFHSRRRWRRFVGAHSPSLNASSRRTFRATMWALSKRQQCPYNETRSRVMT